MQTQAGATLDLIVECGDAAQARQAQATVASLGIAPECVSIIDAPGGAHDAPGELDGRMFGGLFRRWLSFGLAGACGSLALLLLVVGMAHAAGAATAGWAPSAMIASVIAGFEIAGFGAAMLALPDLAEINAPASMRPRVRMVVRVHDERERARLEAALARLLPAAPAAPSRHAA